MAKTRDGDDFTTNQRGSGTPHLMSDTDEEDSPDFLDRMVVTVSKTCRIKRVFLEALMLSEQRFGDSIIALVTRDTDAPRLAITADARDTILFFTSSGISIRDRSYELPAATHGIIDGTLKRARLDSKYWVLMRTQEVRMGRGIKFTKFVQKIEKQKRIFGKPNPPGHPDPKIFREGNLEQATKYMAFWKIEPAWGDPAGTGESGLIYRSIPGSKGDVHVRNSVDDIELWSRGLGLLIEDKEELKKQVAVVQKLIRDKASRLTPKS